MSMVAPRREGRVGMHLRIHLEGVRVDVRRKFGLHANLLLDGKRRFNAIGLQGMAGWYRLPPARPERILVQERNMNIQLRACGQVFVFVLAFCLLDSCKRMIQPEGSPMTSQTNRPPSVLDTVSDDDFFRGGISLISRKSFRRIPGPPRSKSEARSPGIQPSGRIIRCLSA